MNIKLLSYFFSFLIAQGSHSSVQSDERISFEISPFLFSVSTKNSQLCTTG